MDDISFKDYSNLKLSLREKFFVFVVIFLMLAGPCLAIERNYQRLSNAADKVCKLANLKKSIKYDQTRVAGNISIQSSCYSSELVVDFDPEVNYIVNEFLDKLDALYKKRVEEETKK